jgi:AcrR family transcriptional regulator
MHSQVERPTPQTRTRRPEGMDNMVEATVRLLRERSPDQITVRDVAEASGHHHRFVQAWFGGKVGLFRAAFDRMTIEGAERVGQQSTPGEIPPEIETTTVLMNWLVATEPGSLDGPRPTPIIDQVVEMYRSQYGLDRDVARLMALRTVGAAVAAILFPGVLGITPEDVSAAAALERELAEALAKSRANPDHST